MTAAEPGRRVAGRYHLIEPIGRGGMGIVWRAHDELLDRPVAVKEVRYNGAIGDELADLNRRTMREARAAGRLTHPNVVVVHDVIEEDGRPWIVMQLVPSRSLGQVIREDGPLPPERAAEIGLEVLKALRNAHAMGVLHRDVKPENVLLADDGRVVLTDFGIARVETDSTMTRTGLVGTPAFMPPERLRGGPAQRESDLWALGATLYAAVEGRPPHDKGAPLPTMHAVLMDEPEPAVHAGRLAPLIEALLRKEPEDRPTYDQIERMLRRALRPEPPPPDTSPQPAAPRPASRVPQTGDSAGPAPRRPAPAARSASGRPPAASAPPPAPPRPAPDDASAGAARAAVPQTGLSLGAEAAAPARPGAKGRAGGEAEGRGAGGGGTGKAAGSARDGGARPEPSAGSASAGREAGARSSGARSAGSAKAGSARSGAAKAAGPKSGAAKAAGAGTGEAADPGGDGRASAASGEESIGPDDPTLPKNVVRKPGGSGSAKAATKTSARSAGSGSAAGESGTASAATSEGSAAASGGSGAGRAKSSGAGDSGRSLADTTRTQKISPWALDLLRAGREPAAGAGEEAGGEGAGRRLGAFGDSRSDAGPTRLGAFAASAGEGGGSGDEKDARAPEPEGTAGGPGGAAAGADAGTRRGEGAEGGADGAAVPGRTAGDAADAADAADVKGRATGDGDGSSGEPARTAVVKSPAEPAAAAARAGGAAGPAATAAGGTRDADAAGGTAAGAAGTALATSAATASRGGSGTAADSASDLDDAGTRVLREWPVLDHGTSSDDTSDGVPAGTAKAAGETTKAAGAAATEADPAAGTARSAAEDDRPAKRPARLSPFPPPYSRPSPQPQARVSPEPDDRRPRRPRPAAAPAPAAWPAQVTVWRRGGLSGLIANPTVRIILVAVPLLVAVAVIAALLGMRDAQNEVSRRSGEPGGTPATSVPGGSPSPGAAGASAQPGGGKAAASQAPAANPSPGDTATATPKPKPSAAKRPAGALPKGWRRYTDPTGFSVGLPKGWKVHERRGSQVFFRGGERSTFLLIDQTRHPKPDAKRDWLAQEKAARHRFSGYKRIRIEKVDYFKTAADWEWTYNSGGARLHVINRGFVTGKRRGYAIYWSTLDRRWKKNLRYFEGFVATFRPAT